ncbi:hypothetical protein M3Y96_00269400 [Aphelenchoides besseyi]|nr:hypothetical protein M3Y96_00269400 [Aphelenchoides besseyi]
MTTFDYYASNVYRWRIVDLTRKLRSFFSYKSKPFQLRECPFIRRLGIEDSEEKKISLMMNVSSWNQLKPPVNLKYAMWIESPDRRKLSAKYEDVARFPSDHRQHRLSMYWEEWKFEGFPNEDELISYTINNEIFLCCTVFYIPDTIFDLLGGKLKVGEDNRGRISGVRKNGREPTNSEIHHVLRCANRAERLAAANLEIIKQNGGTMPIDPYTKPPIEDLKTSRIQIRGVLLDAYEAGKTPHEALHLLEQKYKPHIVCYQTVLNWYNKFDAGNKCLEDKPRKRPQIPKKTANSTDDVHTALCASPIESS